MKKLLVLAVTLVGLLGQAQAADPAIPCTSEQITALTPAVLGFTNTLTGIESEFSGYESPYYNANGVLPQALTGEGYSQGQLPPDPNQSLIFRYTGAPGTTTAKIVAQYYTLDGFQTFCSVPLITSAISMSVGSDPQTRAPIPSIRPLALTSPST